MSNTVFCLESTLSARFYVHYTTDLFLKSKSLFNVNFVLNFRSFKPLEGRARKVDLIVVAKFAGLLYSNTYDKNRQNNVDVFCRVTTVYNLP